MDKPSLIGLLDYHYWANRQLWYAVLALSEAQFTQTLSDGSPPIRTQIVGMVAHENLWLDYLWHDEVEFLQDIHFPTRAMIRAEWDALEEEMHDFIDELSPDGLQRRIEPAFLNDDVSLHVWEIVLHIIMQATASRAHLRLHLQHLGSPAKAQDFIDFVSEQGQPVPLYPALHAFGCLPQAV